MEDMCQVFIVGDSLFAETLSQMLASSGSVGITDLNPPVGVIILTPPAQYGQDEDLFKVLTSGARGCLRHMGRPEP